MNPNLYANYLEVRSMMCAMEIESVADRVRYVLAQYPGNLVKLAKKLGVTKGAVSSWRREGIKHIRAENLFKIADETGFSARWIALGDGPMKEAKPESYDAVNIERIGEILVRVDDFLAKSGLTLPPEDRGVLVKHLVCDLENPEIVTDETLNAIIQVLKLKR